MKHQVVGYIRVSSNGQNTDRQLTGIELDKKFTDIFTGSVKDRKNLIACLDYLREGDTLVVDSIDRLARNLRDLQDIIHSLLKKGVSVRFVKENLFFTVSVDPMANLMLHMMGAFAEFENSLIRSRQREGIDAAKKAGRPLGRPPAFNDSHKETARKMKEEGISIRQIAFKMKISRASVYKLLAGE